MTTSIIKTTQKAIVCVTTTLMLNACATYTEAPIGVVESAWDFDHHLQFNKTKIDENHYRLEAITSKKANFSRLSAFLLRKSYLICGGYGFTLKPVKGIESVDFKKASPNLIRGNLVADIECPSTTKTTDVKK